MAIRAGMNEKEFLHSTPKYINMFIEAYEKKIEYEIDMIKYQSWLTGYYTLNAIGCSLSKKNKYPDNPFEEKKKSIKEIAKNNGKTEEEINQQLLYMTLKVKQANARLGN